VPRTCEGPVAWEPSRVQDGDLVPLTAGLVLRMPGVAAESRAKPHPTPDPLTLMTAEAKHRGDTARRHRDREAEGRHGELSFSKVPRTAMAGPCPTEHATTGASAAVRVCLGG
jgi:hypothetical protein